MWLSARETRSTRYALWKGLIVLCRIPTSKLKLNRIPMIRIRLKTGSKIGYPKPFWKNQSSFCRNKSRQRAAIWEARSYARNSRVMMASVSSFEKKCFLRSQITMKNGRSDEMSRGTKSACGNCDLRFFISQITTKNRRPDDVFAPASFEASQAKSPKKRAETTTTENSETGVENLSIFYRRGDVWSRTKVVLNSTTTQRRRLQKMASDNLFNFCFKRGGVTSWLQLRDAAQLSVHAPKLDRENVHFIRHEKSPVEEASAQQHFG